MKNTAMQPTGNEIAGKTVYYRVHNPESAFCEENAFSAPWGDDEADPQRGYSCFDDVDRLLRYWIDEDDSSSVAVFHGNYMGYGADNEDLVVPTQLIAWTTLGALRNQ